MHLPVKNRHVWLIWERVSILNFSATTCDSDFSEILCGKLMFQRVTTSAIFITNTDFFVAFVQMRSSLQTAFLLLLILLCFPVSNLLSLIFCFTY